MQNVRTQHSSTQNPAPQNPGHSTQYAGLQNEECRIRDGRMQDVKQTTLTRFLYHGAWEVSTSDHLKHEVIVTDVWGNTVK